MKSLYSSFDRNHEQFLHCNILLMLLFKQKHLIIKAFLLFMILGSTFSVSGQLQSKAAKDGFGMKEPFTGMATIQSDKIVLEEQPQGKAISDDETYNNQLPETLNDAPLAARTASVSGPWSSTATWGGSAVPTSLDAVTINSGITVTVDILMLNVHPLLFPLSVLLLP
jgi:hypothetical protein